MSFGLRVATTLALPGLVAAADGPRVEVVAAPADEVQRAFSGSCDPPQVARGALEGMPWTVERGIANDLLARWGDAGVFVLGRAGALVLVAGDPDDAAWQRVVLDSVLSTAALAAGFEALHAAVVLPEDGRGAVALVGGQGAGKTSIALALLARGGRLVADDVAVLDRDEPALVHPGPRLMNVPVASGARAGAGAARGVPDGATTLATFPDDRWVLLPPERAVGRPIPLRAVVLLDRTAPPGSEPAIRPVAFPAAVLLTHALDSGQARRAVRLDRLAALAAAIPTSTLQAPPASPPDELAALLTAST